jgi:subtilisin family serine protease
MNIGFANTNFKIRINSPIISENLSAGGWHLNKIGLTSTILKSSINSKTIVIAVIDSGINLFHPDLQKHIYTNINEIPDNGIDDDNNGYVDDVHGYNFVNNNSNTNDDNGHGTHISGIIAGDCNPAAKTCGILKNAKIMPLKFLSKEGMGDTNSAIAAINYAVKMKADIINASWGSEDSSPKLLEAITNARNAGIMFVTASGNYGNNNDINPIYPANFNLVNIVSVAAIDEFSFLDDFSNFGSNTVHVAAPGKNILSTYLNSSYESLSGTSMATPIVTGIIGLLMQYHPKSSYLEIKNALMKGCIENENLSDKVICRGRVNIINSLIKF